MRIDDLARHAGMIASSFHQWFRRVILRNERLDVGTVSRRVGYESSSQFSREYRRLFGKPPVREISKGTSPK